MIAAMTLFALLMAKAAASDDERLAEIFSPILILTEETSTEYDRIEPIQVIKPEPVSIVGAEAAANIWVSAYEYSGIHAMTEPLNSSRWYPRMDEFQENNWYPNEKVIFQENKFAFLDNAAPRAYFSAGGGLSPGNYLIRTHFEYPGNTASEWNNTYFGTGKQVEHHPLFPLSYYEGENHPNTAYVHIYERTIDAYKAQYDPVTVIQYKYFYPYNDWWNNHEGDWQGIDVVVSSRDLDTAEFLGVEYRFHGAWVNYYKDYYDDKDYYDKPAPGIIDSFVFNATGDVRLIGTHPVAYIGAGSHAAYPIGGHIKLYSVLETAGKASGAAVVSDEARGSGDWEYMSHTGLVQGNRIIS